MILRILLAILLFASPCFAGVQDQHRAVLAVSADGATCSDSTDYVGFKTIGTPTGGDAAEDTMYVFLVTPVCASGCSSGTFSTGYLHHDSTATDYAKLCLYEDVNTDGSPDSGDTEVECVQFGSALVELKASDSDFTETVYCNRDYFLMIVSNSTEWRISKDSTTGTAFYQNSTGSYTSPPVNLIGTWTPLTRETLAHVEIGP